jgi:aminopeptidase
VDYRLSFSEENRIFLQEAGHDQLDYVRPDHKNIMETYDAYLVIRAPYNLREDQNTDPQKSARRQKALHPVQQTFFNRIADKSLKRSLCQFPTQAAAQEAGMSLEEYEHFVYQSCFLFDENPVESWKNLGNFQQKIVDFLHGCDIIRYVNDNTDISFSVKGRTWINSDGKNNMPSGEVFSAPLEDSVNGHIYFDYPSIYMGHEVEGVTLTVENGYIQTWTALRGKEFLDQIFSLEGARRFGEVAIATNFNIQKPTKNILFDEKIGGTVHMAVGQSYKQCGGQNTSAIHWDLITEMKYSGQIYADGRLIYENGRFLID